MNNNLSARNTYEVYSTTAREEMLPFIPESATTVLDVGCSVGNFGALLKSKRGIQVWGVEADAEAAEIASRRLDGVYSGQFGSDLVLTDKKFDCIVFNDVLEHMVDPYGALEYARGLLELNGKIVASIPNVRYFGNIWLLIVHKSWEYTDTGILDRTHLRFFTKKSIHSMFTALGFDIESITGITPVEKFEPYFYRKYRFLNLLTFGHLEDMRWLQYAVVVNPGNS